MDTENWLAEHGAKFTKHVIPITNIDVEESHKNQARVGIPLDEDVVLLYGVAMEAGDEFPPIVVYRNGNGKYVTVDGNHRVASAETANIKELSALVIENPTPNMVETLTYEANTKHGLPTSIDERVQQALHLAASGMTMPDAAKALGIPLQRLERASEQRTADARIYRLRRSAMADVVPSSRRRLNSIRGDAVLVAALELVARGGLNTNDVSDLVTEVNRQRSESDQMLVIQREVNRQATRVAATAGGKIALPQVLVSLNRAIVALDRIDPKGINKAWPIVGEAMKLTMLGKLQDAHRRLHEIVNE